MRVAAINNQIQRSRARLSELDQELPILSQDAESLARVLAAIVPHIHGDECPVCKRDFSELRKGPLSARVSASIASLTSIGSPCLPSLEEVPSPLRIYFWWFETFRSSMGRSIFGARRDSLGFAHFPVEGQRLRGTCSIHARKPLDLADALEFTSAAIEAGEGGQELIDRREGPHA